MKNHNEVYLKYKKDVDRILNSSISKTRPQTLYKPIKYILSAGGKRIRPMMLIFSCEAAGGKIKDAIAAAVAIEMLHNFTLVHDDIMDNADTRRGMQTIHKKWNENVAILCGDHLIGIAYSYLLKTKSKRIAEIVKVFTDGIIEVCEGQSFDKEFEDRKNVSLDEYLMMIKKKTAKMLETSVVIGSLIGNATAKQTDAVRNYALNIGLAFQIQDDLLDIASDESKFGKKIGGDLAEGKKTYLLLKAAEIVNDKADRKKISDVIMNKGLAADSLKKINEIKKIYEKHGVIDSAKKKIKYFTSLADKSLDRLAESEYKERLKWFSEMLMKRAF